MPSEPVLSVIAESNVEMTARDGTILRSDIYRPEGGGKFPVLLCRTPYDKTTPRYIETAGELASRGYVAVLQDQRGRYASDGEYRWMFRDRTENFDMADGYDACEWAADLPWSDGQVGTWGHSNASWLAWHVIGSEPPSFRAALISGIFKDVMDLNFGIFETGRRLEWTYMMAADARRKAEDPTGPHTPAEATERWNEVERGKYIWWLPLVDIPGEVFSTLDDQLQRYYGEQNIEHSRFGEFHPVVKAPIYHITGWWDRLIGAVDNYQGVVEYAPDALKSQHRLIVGPWGHDATQLSRKIGPVDHGSDADRTYAGLIARWYDYQFKGIENDLVDEDPVQLFILGEDKWRGEKEWPLARTESTPFYLRSGGAANTVHGDGGLSIDPPDGAASDEYDYDPRDPVMSLMRSDSQAAPVDQAPHDYRRDILVYQTPPLERDIEVTGPLCLKLWAITDGPDTDWTAKLAVVYEDGLCVNLTYGITRAQFRNGYDNPELVEPGKAYEYTVKINPTGILFKQGQRIRLYVSSSDFPNFDRNHNTGKPFWTDTELRVAHQTILHDADHPSRLILPVIPR